MEIRSVITGPGRLGVGRGPVGAVVTAVWVRLLLERLDIRQNTGSYSVAFPPIATASIGRASEIRAFPMSLPRLPFPFRGVTDLHDRSGPGQRSGLPTRLQEAWRVALPPSRADPCSRRWSGGDSRTLSGSLSFDRRSVPDA